VRLLARRSGEPDSGGALVHSPGRIGGDEKQADPSACLIADTSTLTG
jgi:hypothetical protein